MTSEELRRFDGRDGRQALIAVNGKVYDVTASARWPEGLHEELHAAGTDLSAALLTAPHVRAVIERFPVVGELVDPPPETPSRFSPLLLAGALALALAVLLLVYFLR